MTTGPALRDTGLTPGVVRHKDRGTWEGVLRDEKRRIVWLCGHHHNNRDNSFPTSGKAARPCAVAHLRRIEWGER